MKKFHLKAQSRGDVKGRSASRRLRHQGQVPAIIYGSNLPPISIALDHNTVYHALKNETFHTSILNLELDDRTEKVLLRDYQTHPFRLQILHLDFQRVNDAEEIVIKVPLHFLNENIAYAVKTQGAHITHVATEVEIKALPSNIPNFIAIDLKDIKAGQTINLSHLVLPTGVVLVNLLRHEDSVLVIAGGITEEEAATDTNVSINDITVGTKPPEKK